MIAPLLSWNLTVTWVDRTRYLTVEALLRDVRNITWIKYFTSDRPLLFSRHDGACKTNECLLALPADDDDDGGDDDDGDVDDDLDIDIDVDADEDDGDDGDDGDGGGDDDEDEDDDDDGDDDVDDGDGDDDLQVF